MLAGVEGLVDVLPGRPRHAVRSAESMRRHAEIVHEPVNPYGATSVSLMGTEYPASKHLMNQKITFLMKQIIKPMMKQCLG